jgi:hypothetical protein
MDFSDIFLSGRQLMSPTRPSPRLSTPDTRNVTGAPSAQTLLGEDRSRSHVAFAGVSWPSWSPEKGERDVRFANVHERGA